MPGDQRLIGRLAFVGIIFVAIASERCGVEQDQVFFERRRGSDHFASGVHGEAAAIENQLVVAADLVDVDDGDVEAARGGGEDFAAQCARLPMW